jgi:phosphonate transport system substrate-binding protein
VRWPALLCFAVCALPVARGETIRFAPLPLEDRRIIHEQFSGLAEHLSQSTGAAVEWVFFDDYAEILRAFRDGKVDLAYLGPLPFVVLRRIASAAEPLACFRDADGAASYTCSLVTFGGSGVQLDNVRGRHIGLTQPYSTCGYLAVSELLGSAGRALDRDGNRFSYAGSHSKAALGVVRGAYDLAGVKTAIARRYEHLNLDCIAESRPYPGFTLSANTATLSDETLAKLRLAARALDPTRNPDAAEITAAWAPQIRNGTVAPELCDYDGIAAALEKLPWPIPGAEPVQ